MHVPSRDGDRLYVQGMTGIGSIHGVFHENCRVVICKGDAFCTVPLRSAGYSLRLGVVHQPIHVAGF